MFKLINFIVFLQIFLHFQFDHCNTFQKKMGQQKPKKKLRNAQKTPFWNTHD